MIDDCSIYTQLQYNTNTNHIRINTKKKYQKEYQKQYRIDHNPNYTEMGSKEHSVMVSCRIRGIEIKDFDDFAYNDKYCNLWNEELREKIRNKYNRCCFLCGKSEEDNGRKLSVHHVDYDKNCGCDGNKCKLIPLCISCHMKTNGNRSYWEDLIMRILN